MKQAVLIAPRQIEFRDVPLPTPGPDDVLLRIIRIGVCGSDVHAYHGRHPYTKCPVIQGHEFSAVIESVGDNVRDLTPGMNVTAMPQVTCGECNACLRGDYHICDDLKVMGFQAPGCAQELFVTPVSSVVPLPDAFTVEQGALVEPAAVAVHAVRRVGDLCGKNAVVLGAGPIGNLVAQVAAAGGASVLITDVSDFRLDFARNCGLAATSNADQEDLPQAIARTFGDDGCDLAFDCAGLEQTASDAVHNIRKGGTLVIVAVFAERPLFDLGHVQDRELNILGTLMYKREDYDDAIDLIAEGKIRTQGFDSKHFPFAAYPAAYDFINAQGRAAMKVFIDLG